MLPPIIVLAYNTYLTFSAITNNPDGACNAFALSANQSQASVITGLVVAILSITWMAFASATSVYSAVSVQEHHNVNPAASAEWAAAAAAREAAPKPNDPKSYQASSDAGSDKSASLAADVGAAAAAAPPAAAAPADGVDARPWVFHIVMFLAGCYLAMMATASAGHCASGVLGGRKVLLTTTVRVPCTS